MVLTRSLPMAGILRGELTATTSNAIIRKTKDFLLSLCYSLNFQHVQKNKSSLIAEIFPKLLTLK